MTKFVFMLVYETFRYLLRVYTLVITTASKFQLMPKVTTYFTSVLQRFITSVDETFICLKNDFLNINFCITSRLKSIFS